MTAAEETSTAASGNAWPQPRLSAKDALSICLAMVANDASLHSSAIAMWKALAPFIPGRTEAQDNLALEALDALANPNPAHICGGSVGMLVVPSSPTSPGPRRMAGEHRRATDP